MKADWRERTVRQDYRKALRRRSGTDEVGNLGQEDGAQGVLW